MIQLSCFHQHTSFELCYKVLIRIHVSLPLAVLFNLTYNGHVRINECSVNMSSYQLMEALRVIKQIMIMKKFQ